MEFGIPERVKQANHAMLEELFRHGYAPVLTMFINPETGEGRVVIDSMLRKLLVDAEQEHEGFNALLFVLHGVRMAWEGEARLREAWGLTDLIRHQEGPPPDDGTTLDDISLPDAI